MAHQSSAESTERVFVALEPPLEVREELAGWLRQAELGRHLRPVAPENIHLTLAFLGEQGAGQISLAASVLDEFADEAPRLAIGAPIWLPPRQPRAFAVEVRPLDDVLGRMQSGIAASLEAALGWRERRTFRPHITVARLPRGFRARRQPPPPTPPLEFEAEALTLYRSRLLPEGAQYDALHSWTLP